MDQAQQRKRTVSYIVNIADHELPGHHSLGVNVVRYDRQSHTLISGGRDGVVSVWRPEGKEEEYGEKGYGEKGYGEKEYGEKEYGEKENIEEKEYVQEKEYGEEEYEQKEYGKKQEKEYGKKEEKQYGKRDYRIKQNANPFAGRSAEANIFTNMNNAEDIKRYIAENVGNEEAVEQLEQQINSESIAGEPVRAGRYKLADTCHRHLDWVRDVKILGSGNRERTELKLATCSNDFSVKIWRTSREAPVMSTVGYHDDYVSCLGYTGQRSHYGAQLVSGGLDKEVKVWDLGRQCAADGFRFAEEKGSVYAVDCFGNCVVAGGPTGVVTLFDRRDMKRPARHFLGHTDTIRGLKMGGKSFVSCSSDTRVCLWDLRVNRAMRIFDMHNSPVWSLYVPSFGDGDDCGDYDGAYDCDPSFDVLYTGDSDGLVVKTDLRASDLDPELVGPHKRGYLNDRVNSNLGISTVVADLSVYKTGKESAGVLGITGGDGTIWTASAVAKDRYLLNWEVPNTTRLAVYQGIRLYENLGVLSNANDQDDHLVLSSAPLNRSATSGAISITASISNDNSDIVSQFSHEDMNQIDAALATPFGVDQAVLGGGSDEGQELGLNMGSNPGKGTQGDTPGEAKVRTLLLSLNGGPSTEYVVRDEVGENDSGVSDSKIDGVSDSEIDGVNNSKIDGVNNSKIDGVNNSKINVVNNSKINVVNNSFSAHPNRHVQINSQKLPDHAVEVVTFNEAPLQSIDGSNGLVLSRLLNNRRHVATMDQNGCIYVIDIVQGGLVRKIDTRDARYAIGSVSDCLDDEDRFEQITDGLQTDESLPQWCSVQTKGGMLFITLKENSFTSCEIYEDEFLDQYAGRALGMEREVKKDEKEHEKNDDNSSSASSISSKPTPRYNLGKVVLKSLFCDFIAEAFTSQQIKIRATIRAKERSEEEREMKSLHKLSVWKTLSRTKSGGRDKTDGRRSLRSVSSSSAASIHSSGDKDIEKKKKKKKKGFFKRYLHHGKHDEDDEEAAKDKHGGSVSHNGSANGEADAGEAQTEEERKKFLEKEYRKQLQDEIMGLTTTKQVLDWMDERGISGPDGVMLADEDDEKKLNTPYFKYDKKIMVTINENIRTYGTDTKTLFLTHMGEQKDMYSSLEDLLPAWVSRAVLLDAYEHIPGRKVEFTVEPDISGLPGLQKLNSNKLSAHSLLRIDRVIAYVKGKLPESEKHGKFEILCRGNVLDNKATLNTVKNRIWKSSGNVQLVYRKKKC